MLRTDIRCLLLACLAGVPAACESDTDPTDADVSGADSGLDVSLDDVNASDAVEVATCEDVEPTTRVSGTLVDEVGEGLAGAKAQVCLRLEVSDRLICLAPADSGVDGGFSVAVPPSAQCATEATMRLLAPGTDRATLYCEVALDDAGSEVVVERPFALPQTTRAVDLPELGDAATMRTVLFDGGLEVDVVPDDLSGTGEDYAALAAVQIDPDSFDVCFTGETAPFALWAFSPEMNVDAAPFAARFPNTSGLDAGATVDLWVLGGLYTTATTRDPLREGSWVKFASATVSEDGTTIDAPRGLPATTWIGLVAAEP